MVYINYSKMISKSKKTIEVEESNQIKIIKTLLFEKVSRALSLNVEELKKMEIVVKDNKIMVI